MNRDKWLHERNKGIGASESASVLGLSSYLSNNDLWEIKVGKRKPDDLSNNKFVQYGTLAEKSLRELFVLDFADTYTVTHEEYKIIRNSEHPFIFATLDGELTETETGRKGILEIKTAEILNKSQWSQWNDRIPDTYYCQICHALLATGFDFALLKAQIKYRKDGVLNITTRHYNIERSEVQEDIDMLKQEIIKFWGFVESRTRPPLKLPPI